MDLSTVPVDVLRLIRRYRHEMDANVRFEHRLVTLMRARVRFRVDVCWCENCASYMWKPYLGAFFVYMPPFLSECGGVCQSPPSP